MQGKEVGGMQISLRRQQCEGDETGIQRSFYRITASKRKAVPVSEKTNKPRNK